MFLRFFFSMIVLILSLPLNAEIYKWIDENGKVNFGDRKIDEIGQKVVTVEKVESKWSRFDISIEAINVELTAEEYRDIVDGVNYVYELFDRVLYFDMYKTVPVNILILKNKSEYNSYLIRHNRSNLTSSYGVYFPKENQIIVYVREDREGTFRTIKHEVSHAIVDTVMPYIPAWLNEGLAEQMETLSRNESGLYLTPHKFNRESLDRAARNGSLTNISDFLKLPSNKWRHSLSGGKVSLQGQAGQFVYFLLSTTPDRNFVVRLLHRFKRGDRKLSYYIVDDNYIGGIKSLEISWRNWMDRGGKDAIAFY